MASNTYNLNTYKAIFLAKEPTLTIGASEKIFDGTIPVSWTATEILGSSDSSKFYRGDKTWSSTLDGDTLKITNNSNTITIGSQNTTYCHIYNSSDIPFAFNNTIISASSGKNLGEAAYPWANLYMGRSNGAGIYYQGTKANYRMIRFIDNTGDEYGNGISIGGGGLTILGSGESADTILSNLSLTSAGGTETTYIGSDSSIEFYPSINSWDAAARISMTAGTLWAGVNGDTTRENRIGVQSGSGQMYMYAQAATTGGRGIYLPAHGSGGARAVFSVGTNNEVYFADGYNGTATRLAYSQSGLAGSAISWLTCWNGYELRAINAENTRKFLFGSSAIGSVNVPIYYNGSNFASCNNKLGAQNANGYWGMCDASGNNNVWIRTTSQGIIPYQSGGSTGGHCGLGTSTWYFSYAYIQDIYGTLHGKCSNIISVKVSLNFTNGRAVYSNSAITASSRIFVTGCNDGSTGMIFSTGVPWAGNVEIHGCDYYGGTKLNWSGTKNNIKILIDNS